MSSLSLSLPSTKQVSDTRAVLNRDPEAMIEKDQEQVKMNLDMLQRTDRPASARGTRPLSVLSWGRTERPPPPEHGSRVLAGISAST